MCNDCGCGSTSATGTGHHPHARDHGSAGARQVDVGRAILEKNDRLAEQNRGFFRGRKLLVLNVVSAPGSGKTTLIEKTAERLAGRLRVAVVVGDLATDNDAQRFRAAGVPVVQINTGTVCHLDASMVQHACDALDLEDIDVLVIENVGNLVCPADFDLGEHLRVVLLSTAEGEDKPLKYPPLFHSAHVAIVTKQDLAGATGFDRAKARENLERISHHATLFELSAKTGSGMDDWCGFLAAERAKIQ